VRENIYCVTRSLLDSSPSDNRFAGWWGHDLSTRFAMPAAFSPVRGAQGFQQSNPCVLAIVCLRGSLKIFKAAGMMQPIRERSVKLTGEFERLLKSSEFFVPLERVGRGTKKPRFSIITPSKAGQRGAQLSLLFLPVGSDTMRTVFKQLCHHGVIGDEREPDVIRLSPAPLYNTLGDCERAVRVLDKVLGSLQLRECRL
jgi:kynureninase